MIIFKNTYIFMTITQINVIRNSSFFQQRKNCFFMAYKQIRKEKHIKENTEMNRKYKIETK